MKVYNELSLYDAESSLKAGLKPNDSNDEEKTN